MRGTSSWGWRPAWQRTLVHSPSTSSSEERDSAWRVPLGGNANSRSLASLGLESMMQDAVEDVDEEAK